MTARMLDVPSLEDFDDGIYQEAADAFVTAAGGVAKISGWAV